MFTYTTLELKDKKIFCAMAGEGRPVVLLHGNGESHAIFSIMIDQLTEAGYRVFAPDSPGQGANEPLAEYHYASMAEDIYECIMKLGLEKPALYGFSDGGILGLMIAISHPGSLSALAVSGANLSPEGLEPSFVSSFAESGEEPSGHEGNADPLVSLMLTEPDIEPSDLRKIEIPVLVTAGSNDLIRRSESEKIAENLPASTLLILENEDHGSYIENSKIMGGLLIDFLRKEGY